MNLKKLINTLLISTIIYSCSTNKNIPVTTKLAGEETRKEQIIKQILNYQGQDTTIFKNYKKELQLVKQQEKYVIYPRDLYYDEDFLKKTLDIKEEQLRNQENFDYETAIKYVEIKNTLKNRDITRKDLPITKIIHELLNVERLISYKINKYVDAINILEPESNIANDYFVHGNARQHLSQIRDTTLLLVKKELNIKNKEKYEFLLKELDKKLELNIKDIRKKPELNQGIYVSETKEGKKKYVVLAEIKDNKQSKIAKEFLAINTATELFLEYSTKILVQKNKMKKQDKIRFEFKKEDTQLRQVNDTIYEVKMVFYNIGNREQNQIVLNSINKEYDSEKDRETWMPINNNYVPKTQTRKIKKIR